MKKNLIELQNILRDNGILISFSGRFSQGIIEELGEAIKNYMEAEKNTKNSIFNVFAIFVEQSQNIRNYTISKEETCNYDKISNSGIVNIGRDGDEYFICSGNLVENNDTAKLIERLELIKGMGKEELKKLYKSELKKELPEDSISAGVGLIDIARKASQPIEYSLDRIDDTFSFYQLRVVV